MKQPKTAHKSILSDSCVGKMKFVQLRFWNASNTPNYENQVYSGTIRKPNKTKKEKCP